MFFITTPICLCWQSSDLLRPSYIFLQSPKPAIITFVNFAVFGFTLICQLPVPLLPISFTPNLITVILSTINSLSLNYPVSSRSRTLLLVLSWKLPSPVISVPSYALFTGSESLNASNTSSSHLHTKFSQLPNLHTARERWMEMRLWRYGGWEAELERLNVVACLVCDSNCS